MPATEGRQRPRRRRWWLVAGALAVLALLSAGAIYKWVDEQGRVHYSDRPPAGQRAEVVEVAPAPPAEQQQAAAARLEELSAESAAISQRVEQERLHRREATERATREEGSRHEACVEALEQRAVLDLARPVYKRQRVSAGVYERVYLADAERGVEKARLDELIEANCSDEAEARKAQRAAALQLELGRQPWCVEMREAAEEAAAQQTAEARERLARFQEEIAESRATCPEVSLDDAWLAQRKVVWRAQNRPGTISPSTNRPPK